MEQPLFVGIDVAKDRLDVHIRPTGEAFTVRHDDAGLATLAERLGGLRPTLVVLEATGGYEVTVAAALASGGLPLAVVNPRQIRAFARATGAGKDRRPRRPRDCRVCGGGAADGPCAAG